jgi:integrase
MKDFIEVDALDREECLDFAGKSSERAHSKRSDLPHLPAGWQERFQEIIALSRQYQDAGLLLLQCGLRPVELAKGVRLRATAVGIEVHILGGKTRETAGQPWRSFVLDPEALPESFVDRVQINGEITVSADPELLRAYLHRLSDRVFLQGKYRPQGARKKSFVLSAYTFRHSVVTALRDSGWDTESIAATIGEFSAQTVACYGTRSRVGSLSPRKTAIMNDSVQAARPVRGVDMDGLRKVLSRTATPVKKKAHLHPRLGP